MGRGVRTIHARRGKIRRAVSVRWVNVNVHMNKYDGRMGECVTCEEEEEACTVRVQERTNLKEQHAMANCDCGDTRCVA